MKQASKGTELRFEKVKLFSGFIYRDEETYSEVRKKLESVFSPVDIETQPMNFDFTTYYTPEMGENLLRRFVSFQQLIDPEQLPDIKILTNQIEVRYADEGNRIINIDPGFLSVANVIIATTKNYYHRVPLTKGIYAHMEYVIKGSTLYPQEWTYPDFRTEKYLNFFKQLMSVFKQQLKSQKHK